MKWLIWKAMQITESFTASDLEIKQNGRSVVRKLHGDSTKPKPNTGQ